MSQYNDSHFKLFKMAEPSNGCSGETFIAGSLYKEEEAAEKDDLTLLLNRFSTKYWHVQ